MLRRQKAEVLPIAATRNLNDSFLSLVIVCVVTDRQFIGIQKNINGDLKKIKINKMYFIFRVSGMRALQQ